MAFQRAAGKAPRQGGIAGPIPFWMTAALSACPAVLGLAGLAHYGIVSLPALRPTPTVLLHALLVAPVLEELVFRGLLQDLIEGAAVKARVPALGPVSAANLLTSVIFAACHLPFQDAVTASLIVVPSLVFGRLKELHASLAPSMLMHGWYNLAFLIAST